MEEFTQATRSEPGNIFFEWSRSVDNPDQFVLVEAFQDDAAAAHVNSGHFKKFVGWAPDAVASTPQIISVHDAGQRLVRDGGSYSTVDARRARRAAGPARPAERW